MAHIRETLSISKRRCSSRQREKQAQRVRATEGALVLGPPLFGCVNLGGSEHLCGEKDVNFPEGALKEMHETVYLH